MPDGTEYTVVPGALRKMTVELIAATERWKTMIAKVDQLKLGENDLGVLANAADYVEGHNAANEVVVEKLEDGAKVFDNTTTTLDDVAKNYEKKEAEWYEEFGYINKEK